MCIRFTFEGCKRKEERPQPVAKRQMVNHDDGNVIEMMRREHQEQINNIHAEYQIRLRNMDEQLERVLLGNHNIPNDLPINGEQRIIDLQEEMAKLQKELDATKKKVPNMYQLVKTAKQEAPERAEEHAIALLQKIYDTQVKEIKEILAEPNAGGTLCVICADNNANVLILPCKHVCVCGECYELWKDNKKCPVCRIEIQNAIKGIHL